MQKLQRESMLYSVGIVLAIGILVTIVVLTRRPDLYRKYSDAGTGITVKYPKDWTIVEKPAEGAIVAFLSPKRDLQDLFTANMNVTYVDLKGQPMTPGQLTQATKQQLAALFEGQFKMIEDKDIFLAGRTGHQIIFVGLGVATPLQYLNAWVLVGDRAYVITYSDLAATFNENLPLVNTMLRSFKIN